MQSAKAHVLPARDPIAGGPLVITEVEAVDSGVTIRGRFEVPRFARLSPDQARFLETFLRCRGMLNSVERELGISYPTARGRLDAVLKALDLHAVREEPLGSPEPPAVVEASSETEFGLPTEPSLPAPTAEEESTEESFWESLDEEPADVAVTAPVAEALQEEEPAIEVAETTKPRRSRDELLSLLERGEITVDELKKELEGTK